MGRTRRTRTERGNAKMENITRIHPGDPRICQSFAIGLMREGNAVSLGLYLAPTGSEKIKAVNVTTPAEARDMAFKLWDAAKKADEAMNAALHPKEEA